MKVVVGTALGAAVTEFSPSATAPACRAWALLPTATAPVKAALLTLPMAIALLNVPPAVLAFVPIAMLSLPVTF
jgi:hypothetical protein